MQNAPRKRDPLISCAAFQTRFHIPVPVVISAPRPIVIGPYPPNPPPSFAGYPFDMRRIQKFARSHKLLFGCLAAMDLGAWTCNPPPRELSSPSRPIPTSNPAFSIEAILPPPELPPAPVSSAQESAEPCSPWEERELEEASKRSTKYGLTLPLDKAIANTCPNQAWSVNVPKRACTKDEQCGDGFCNRGQCAAIWTCDDRHGQRCQNDEQCRGVCVEGRCRSCESDAECRRDGRTPDAFCTRPLAITARRNCFANVHTGPPIVSSVPTPKTTPAPSLESIPTPAPTPARRPCVVKNSSMIETPPSEEYELRYFPLKDRAIADLCPQEVWSTHVPKRTCKKDEECGDGFCDRGKCAAILTCRARYGQRCETPEQCESFVCLDGRCRSCASDKECELNGTSANKCDPHPNWNGSLSCNHPGWILPPPPASASPRP